MAFSPAASGWFQSVLSVSAPLTILPSSTRAGSRFSWYFFTNASNEHSLPWWPNSTPFTSKGVAPSRWATSNTLSSGTNRNSAWGSMNLRMSQGQATRSTFTLSRVTHFTAFSFLSSRRLAMTLHRLAPLGHPVHIYQPEFVAGQEFIREVVDRSSWEKAVG